MLQADFAASPKRHADLVLFDDLVQLPFKVVYLSTLAVEVIHVPAGIEIKRICVFVFVVDKL